MVTIKYNLRERGNLEEMKKSKKKIKKRIKTSHTRRLIVLHIRPRHCDA